MIKKRHRPAKRAKTINVWISRKCATAGGFRLHLDRPNRDKACGCCYSKMYVDICAASLMATGIAEPVVGKPIKLTLALTSERNES